MFKSIWATITFKSFRDKREAVKRRKNYDAIKAQIVQEHLNGFAGLVLDKKYDIKDQASFKPPMYYIAKNQHDQLCIFWRKDLMTEEVGPPKEKPTLTLAPVDKKTSN